MTITNSEIEQLQQYTLTKLCECGLSLSSYVILLYSPFLWWCKMTKCLRDEVKWNEWGRDCCVALGDYWPSGNMSEEGSSALDDPESLSYYAMDGWKSWAGQSGTAPDFITLLWMECNLKLMNCLIFHLIFLGLSWPQATETAESETTDKRDTAVKYSYHKYLTIF